MTMGEDKIYITQQFEKASDTGYARLHGELAHKLQGLFERNLPTNQETLFRLACEDVARDLLLSEDALTSVPVVIVQEMIELCYNGYLENPERLSSPRTVAVH